MKFKNKDVKVNEVRLKNVAFPLWLLMFVPITWLFFIPGNFLIDSLVLFISMEVFKLSGKKDIYKQNILKVFLFGMLSKIIGTVFLALMSYTFKLGTDGNELYLTIPALILSGGLIFVFNYFFTFKNMDKKLRFKLALILAIATAPYIFVLPITWTN